MSRAKKAIDVDAIDESLLDLVDHILTKGVVVTGELLLGVADVDLVYVRVAAVLCAADRVLADAKRRRKPSSKPSLAGRAGALRLR
jgi:hypothetical protein